MMRSQDLWQVFLDTGAPEVYLLYNKARKAEMTDVSESKWLGSENNNLQ